MPALPCCACFLKRFFRAALPLGIFLSRSPLAGSGTLRARAKARGVRERAFNLSYGIRFPYSGAKFTTALEPRSPLTADKGPYFEAGDEGVPGTNTVRDRRSSVGPNLTWRTLSAEKILRLNEKSLQEYNSRNHKGAGQVVAFADGHANFLKTPFAGIDNDNIYTMQALEDPLDALIGRVPNALETIGPIMERDTFIVP